MNYDHLSHLDLQGYGQFITFRTADSTDGFLLKLAAEGKSIREQQMAIDKYLDASGQGAYLHGDVLRFLYDFLRAKDGDLYTLACFAIMPNHVHMLIKPRQALSRLMQRVKGASAKGINDIMGRRGTFWEKDYHDKAIRDEHHFRVVYEYIKNNPLKSHSNIGSDNKQPTLNASPGGAASAAQTAAPIAAQQCENHSTAEAVLPEALEQRDEAASEGVRPTVNHQGGAALAAQITVQNAAQQCENHSTAEAVLPEALEQRDEAASEGARRSVNHQGGAASAAQNAVQNAVQKPAQQCENHSTAEAVRPVLLGHTDLSEEVRFYGVYDV